MATINSTLGITDRMSAPLASIAAKMNEVLAAARALEGVDVSGIIGQMATGLSAASSAVSEVSEAAGSLEATGIGSELEQAAVGIEETDVALTEMTQAMDELPAVTENASAAIMSIQNSISQAENAMNLASMQAESYRNRMEQIIDTMDRNEAAITAMNRQQELTYSDSRQAEIERMVTAQDRLNDSYQRAEIALTRANNAYAQQQNRIDQLNQRLAETSSRLEQQGNNINNINRRLRVTQRNTESIQRSAARVENPFKDWLSKAAGVYSTIRLINRMLNMIKKSVTSVLDATGKWKATTDGTATVMNKFNKSIEKSQKLIGDKLLPLAAVGSEMVADAFDWMAQKAVGAVEWINDNIDKIIMGLTLAGVGIAALAAVWILHWAIMNAPLLLIVGLVAAVASGLVNAGITVTDVLGVAGMAFGALYAVVDNVVTLCWNAIGSFVNFIGNAFNDPVGAVKVLFYDMAIGVIEVIQGMVTAIIDLINLIPGVSVGVTDGVGSFLGNVLSVGLVPTLMGDDLKDVVGDPVGDAMSKLQAERDATKEAMDWREYVEPREYKDIGDTAREFSDKFKDFGDKLGGIGDKLNNFDLNKYTAPGKGGKALRTTGEVKIAEEDIKMLLDIATREYQANFQTLTPQVNVHVDNINNDTDAQDFIEKLADAIDEVSYASLVNA